MDEKLNIETLEKYIEDISKYKKISIYLDVLNLIKRYHYIINTLQEDEKEVFHKVEAQIISCNTIDIIDSYENHNCETEKTNITDDKINLVNNLLREVIGSKFVNENEDIDFVTIGEKIIKLYEKELLE